MIRLQILLSLLVVAAVMHRYTGPGPRPEVTADPAASNRITVTALTQGADMDVGLGSRRMPADTEQRPDLWPSLPVY